MQGVEQQLKQAYEGQSSFYKKWDSVTSYYEARSRNDKEGAPWYDQIFPLVATAISTVAAGYAGAKIGEHFDKSDLGKKWNQRLDEWGSKNPYLGVPTTDQQSGEGGKKAESHRFRNLGMGAGAGAGAFGGYAGATACTATFSDSFAKWYENRVIVPVMADQFGEIMGQHDPALNQCRCRKTNAVMQSVMRHTATGHLYDSSIAATTNSRGEVDIGNKQWVPLTAFEEDYLMSLQIRRRLHDLATMMLDNNLVQNDPQRRILRKALPVLREQMKLYYFRGVGHLEQECVAGRLSRAAKAAFVQHYEMAYF